MSGVSLSISDAREILADNTALVAEIAAKDYIIAEERARTLKLVDVMEQYIETSSRSEKLLETQVALLKQKVAILEQKVRVQSRTWGVLGAIGGICVGLIF